MFNVGAAHGHEDRVNHASTSTSTNVAPPSEYGLRKDHKDPQPGEELSGPKVRGVCGATEAPNSRLGHFLSMIVNNYADAAGHENECESGEEMKAAFEAFNKLDKEKRLKCEIISMDVKALYPSMRWDIIVKSVREMIENSEMDINNVDYNEVGKYLAVMMSEEDIENEGLSHVVPKMNE